LIDGDIVDIGALRTAGLINSNISRVKIFLSGKLNKALTVKGIVATKGAEAAIEAAGGKIEE
jgi:large subunit ribosomal protein L15